MTQAPVSRGMAIAATRIGQELTRKAKKPISLGAGTAEDLEEAAADYLGDLGQEAIRLARRDRLSVVDKEHVQQAIKRLNQGGTSAGAAASAANSIGGLLAGAGLASAYAIFFTPGPHGLAEIGVALALSGTGFSTLVFGITQSFRR